MSEVSRERFERIRDHLVATRSSHPLRKDFAWEILDYAEQEHARAERVKADRDAALAKLAKIRSLAEAQGADGYVMAYVLRSLLDAAGQVQPETAELRRRLSTPHEDVVRAAVDEMLAETGEDGQ